uniref:Uncharacterized protein n=1 Tax=Anguilla anguilla TaxID=7936 RepID=A0A0E9UR13_ANGAN
MHFKYNTLQPVTHMSFITVSNTSTVFYSICGYIMCVW